MPCPNPISRRIQRSLSVPDPEAPDAVREAKDGI